MFGKQQGGRKLSRQIPDFPPRNLEFPLRKKFFPIRKI